MNLFVAGIGTNVGKTIVSAILTEALEADYWKPIQSGTIEGKDSETVKSLITNSKTVIHPETYLLKEPLSPHFAAKLENVEIDLNKIELPVSSSLSSRGKSRDDNKALIIEGAGGLLVPINDKHFVIDIAKKFDSEVVLVISSYLGCINHSLLSIDYLLRNNFKIHSLVFNGEFEEEVKSAIINHIPGVEIIAIPTLKNHTKEEMLKVSHQIRRQLVL
jgi:dethiobiotin synthetase